MAERRVQMRQGRRERRRDGDGDGDIKRRSRSEGPTARRVIQSMDVGSGNNGANRKNNHNHGNGSYERRGGTKGNRDSPTGSDDGGFVNPDPSGSDSDSDSDRMQWTKNPLLVRKLKKNKAEKRSTNADNSSNSSNYKQLGQRNTNRESWVYLAPEGTPFPLHANQEQQKGDSGSNSGSLKNKYQKLEEMRKKRIDIAMTSDEENTPESRISRLRQRALQGALGSPVKPDNSRVTVSDHNNWGSPVARSGSAVMSDQGGTRQLSAQSVGHYNKQSVVAQPQAYRSVVVPPQSANQSRLPTQDSRVISAQPVLPQRRTGQVNSQSPQQMPVRQTAIKPFMASHELVPVNNMGQRQQFRTIPDPQVGGRIVHNSSPEIQVRRFNPAARVPSADSIYDGTGYTQEIAPNRSIVVSRPFVPGHQASAQVNPPSQDVMEVERGTAHQYRPPANRRHSGQSQFNEVVELRLKSSRVIDRPLSQSLKDAKGSKSTKREDCGFRSEDSLDELIESNIQFLEKEIKQTGSKKSTVPVSRSSSLPDPRKGVVQVHKPQVTVSGQHSVNPIPQASTPAQHNKSELHFRVPLQPQNANMPAPQIQIADVNQWSDSSFPGATSHTFGVVPRVERKHSYDSRTRSSRPTSEHFDRDDVSKSDTQLNAAVVQPTYRGNMLHPNYMPGRGYSSDQNLTTDYSQGMFSDVDYDIEVSERVKKWETFMTKKPEGAATDGKKPVLLAPIEERMEGDRDSLMMPSEIRKSMRLAQNTHTNPPIQDQQLSLVSLKPATSDPTLHLAADARGLVKESNVQRFFQVVPDPNASVQPGPLLSHSTSSIYIDMPRQTPQVYSQPSLVYQPGGLMSPDQLREHMLANQRSRMEAERSAGAPQLALAYDNKRVPDPPERSHRLSRYQDEIEEMTTVKHQSVSNLRRQFDETKGMTSEEESRPESRVAKVSPTQKDNADVNWSQMITGLENRIRDMEVWSPNMESTQGNVVSIERVKARTLQTIPFSEDPFWKEIEEMTTFDPNSLGGHLSVSEEAIKPSVTHMVEESPHSSTLPTQPRHHSAMSAKERMQRSKSLYTPNITPLTINVEPYSGGKTSSLERTSNTDKYSGPSALDEVLEDIRTSLERKPLSPKRKPGESSDSHRSSPGPSHTSEILRQRSEKPRGQALPTGNWDKIGSSYNNNVNQPMSITISSSVKPAPPAAAVSGMTVGHYHLDPHLLKQKLLRTGLVEDDNKPEPPARSRVPAKTITATSVAISKPVAIAPPQAVIRSVVTPTQRPSVAVARPAQEDKLSQVTNSMEDLRQLAVNVERKISAIKSRLVTADDQNLDNILLSLRKFAPTEDAHSSDLQPGSMQDFYHKKKTKLEDALTELDRIHTTLDLKNDMLLDRPDRRNYPSYQARPLVTSANANSLTGIGPSASPNHSKSSLYISSLPVATVQAETAPFSQQVTTKVDTDKQAQSEFDVISKSFQAIIDEVNKTASLVSSASTPQPKPRKPLPEIKELQSKLYATKEQIIQNQVASPETQRRPLNVTLISQQTKSPPVSTPKSPPPVVAPKPSLRMPSSVSLPQKPAPTAPQTVSSSVNVVTSSIQTPVTSVAQAEVAQPAPEKRETRMRGRFRPKPANQEKEDANRRARSKSSPMINLQDVPTSAENKMVTSEGQQNAKTQLNFQLEPVSVRSPNRSRKPPLKLDVAKAQQSSVVELQLKPPVMFQDSDDKDQPPASTAEQTTVVKPPVECAPPMDSKTVVFPGSPITTSITAVSVVSSATQPVPQSSNKEASSSDSSAEGVDKDKNTKQRMGRGVAMMVEMFSSSDDERLRRSHPLHTRSAPDLSAEIQGDDATVVPKDISNIRPAELTRLMQHKAFTGSPQGSPATERKRAGSMQSDMSSPQSPSNKPPFHPFKRQQPSPDRTSENSSQRNVVVGPPDTKVASTDVTTSESPTAAVSKTVPRRSVSCKTQGDDVPERPRSFHELLSSFEPDAQRLSKLRSQNKYASEEVLPGEIVVSRVFRASSFTSEPDLRENHESAPTPQEVRQWCAEKKEEGISVVKTVQ